MKPQSGRSKITPVTQKTAKEIVEHAKPEYTPDVASFPLGVCMRCTVNLNRCEKKVDGKKQGPNKAIKAIWDGFKLQNIYIPRGQDSLTCCCDICKARRTKLNKEDVKVIPKSQVVKVEAPVVEKKKALCTDCLQELAGPGFKHPCGAAARKQNLAQLILQEQEGEQVIAIS